MKTSLILTSYLMAATLAWGQEEEAASPPSELPPAESLPSLEEMSRMGSDQASTPESSTDTSAEEAAPEEKPEAAEPAKPEPEKEEAAAPSEEPTTQEKAETKEEAPQAEPAPAPEPDALTPDEAPSASSTNSVIRSGTGHYGSDFGSFRMGIGAGQPTFDKKVVKYYDDLYGKPRLHPDLFLDYYFFDWYLTLGVGARMRYYRTEGHAAQTSNPASNDSLSSGEIDTSSSLELVLVPLQGVITAEITPWRTSFFTLNAWTGVERMYVQETRHPKEEKTAATSFVATDDSNAKSTYVNRGWNTASVVGASISLRLDYFDRTSVNSLDIMGFRSVFLTPYMEIVKTQKAEMGKWDRRVLGLLFTFESIR